MNLTIELPVDVEKRLRAANPNLDAVAKEALLVSLYRQGGLYHKQLAQLLGLDRWQIEDVLRKHNVTEDLITADELAGQVRASHKLRHGV